MVARGWRACLVASFITGGLCAGPPPAAMTAAGANDSTSVTERFETDGDGGVVVAVRLNGVGPFRLLLDTGSTHTAITAQVARTIGAPFVAWTLLASAIAETEQAVARIDRFQVGATTVTGVLPTIIDTTAVATRQRLDGVLGQDVLSPLRFEIDFQHRRLTWNPPARPSDPSGMSFDLTPVAGRYVLSLPQARGTLRLVPDTGAAGLVLFGRPPSLPITPAGRRRQDLVTVNGRAPAQQAVVPELRIGARTWRDVPTVLVTAHQADDVGADGLLPLHGFRRVTFDGAERRLHVE